MYRVYAESVLHDGWTMPAVSGSYSRPAGFLYVYFVAGVMSVLGTELHHGLSSSRAPCSVSPWSWSISSDSDGGSRRAGASSIWALLQVSCIWTRFATTRTGSSARTWCSSCCLSRWCSFSGQASGHPWAWRRSQASRSAGHPHPTEPAPAWPWCGSSPHCVPGFWRPDTPSHDRDARGRAGHDRLHGLPNYVVTGAPSVAVFTVTGDWVRPRIPTDAGLVKQGWAVVAHFGRRVLYMMDWPPMIDAMQPPRFCARTGFSCGRGSPPSG